MVCIPGIQNQDTTTLRDINSNNSNNRGIKRILRTNVLIIKFMSVSLLIDYKVIANNEYNYFYFNFISD
jgi:hypothetical protein